MPKTLKDIYKIEKCAILYARVLCIGMRFFAVQIRGI